jgi:hypothetical protein
VRLICRASNEAAKLLTRDEMRWIAANIAQAAGAAAQGLGAARRGLGLLQFVALYQVRAGLLCRISLNSSAVVSSVGESSIPSARTRTFTRGMSRKSSTRCWTKSL